jgi:hypothetical protein
VVAQNYEHTAGPAEDSINVHDADLEKLLDRAWACGMRTVVELPRLAVEKGRLEQVRRRIETFRHHPGLLCWDSEERIARGKATVKEIAALYRLVHTLDPDHPFLLGDSKDLTKRMATNHGDYFPSADMDIGIWWWYPFPLKAAEPLDPPVWLTNGLCPKPLWVAIQAYKQPFKDSRYPTPSEYRDQAYLSIINGVKGLFFYTGFGEHDYHHQLAGLLNQPEASHWEYVKTLVKELRDISPFLMAPAPADAVSLSPAGSPVEYTVRETADGTLYIIAANKSTQPQTVHFSVPTLPGHHVETLYENHPVSLEGKVLSDQFGPFGAHVYKLQ